MNALMLRRMAMMAQKKEGPNGLQPTAACGTPNTVAYVGDDGLLYITYVQAYRTANPLFKRPISLSVGDSVTVQLKNTGTTSSQYFSDVFLGSLKIISNNAVDLRKGRTYTKTVTIGEDIVVDSFGWYQRTSGNFTCDFIIEVQIYVNDKRVI